eukprot:TRINITY_DN17293_c0_g1_i2.p4 TRINITY_DN17293_c0_g1~~TRINITY_DN17293_c0_g1_i2.p4  ORF type:complete len:119 (-),score=21.34 TRINITY_DN17293_c0_g1_i2:311-667(-)
MVNQVELHPYLTQRSLREACQKWGIQLVAYSPLGCGQLLSDELVVRIAKERKWTAAQVLLAWGLQQDLVVIPKSIRKERMVENAAVAAGGCLLTETEMQALDALNQDKHFCWSPEGVS